MDMSVANVLESGMTMPNERPSQKVERCETYRHPHICPDQHITNTRPDLFCFKHGEPRLLADGVCSECVSATPEAPPPTEQDMDAMVISRYCQEERLRDSRKRVSAGEPAPPTRKRFFLDTEFIERGPNYPISLISIGIVDQEGREFYAENYECPWNDAGEWVKANVYPHLKGPRLTLAAIAKGVREFIGDCKPEFWGYYADYDWVVFCQIFGAMVDLPKGWPMYCRDINQACGELRLPQQSSTEHNALNDAKWNKEAFEFVGASLSGSAPSTQLQVLASALKKVLPPQLLQEVIDHCDPLAAFLRDGFGVGAPESEGKDG